MYPLDTSSFGDYIQTILRLVGGGLRLDPEAFRQVYQTTGEARGVILWIVFIAGLSLMIGQSVVLFANRVSRRRFAVSLMLGALKFVFDVAVVVAAVWAIANLVGQNSWPLAGIARAIALASAPYWLSFLFLIPYIGIIWERVTRVYVFVALVVALQAVFAIPFFDAILAALLAIVLAQLATVALDRLLNPLSDRLTRLLGDELEYASSRDIYEKFVRQAR